MISVPYNVVVSTENSQYMAWQTQLFCYSAATRLNHKPIVIVHREEESLRSEFTALRDAGFPVVEAPSFIRTPTGDGYPPRNELGSLLVAASLTNLPSDHILFCEADMLFVGPVGYADHIAGDYYYYMNYFQPRIDDAVKRLGLKTSLLELNKTSQIGVPYFIPTRLLKRIAHRWLEVLDTFKNLEWIDIMYAFGLALAIERLKPATTHLVDHNYRPLSALAGNIIHYCYVGHIWDKRSYRDFSPLDAPHETFPRVGRTTVLGEIVAQISEASAFFHHIGKTSQASLSTSP